MDAVLSQTKTFDEKSNLLKWLAIILMTVDHVGAYIYPQLIWMRIIGRIAFPLFLYTTVLGTRRTRNFKRYFLQLLFVGVISIPVTLDRINILFSLAIFALSMRDKRFFIPCLFLSYFVEYGIYGFLMGWTIYLIVYQNRTLGIVAFLSLHILMVPYPAIQFFAVMALIPILMPFKYHVVRLPKVFGYFYYPLHLAVIFLKVGIW